MISRQETILKLVIEEHVRTASPVSSLQIVSRFDLGVSPATVRNDMCALEETGHLAQPHTSSGRVPTEAGYQYYLANFLHLAAATSARKRLEESVAEAHSADDLLRRVARTLGELSGETAVAAIESGSSVYAGLPNLFDKPEFHDVETLHAVVQAFDEMEDILSSLFGSLKDEPVILIGANNPFGEALSSVFVRYRAGPSISGMVGIIGPMRMDYGKNAGLVRLTHDILCTSHEHAL
jgi:transcriptional regulator of heat shock response